MVNMSKISIFLVGLMVISCFAGVYAENPTGKDIHVSKEGVDSNNGLTPETSKKNIEAAYKSANPGDTIHVGPGRYFINLKLYKNITLRGNNQILLLTD
ncbi:MAG: hypothetical protein PHY59_08820 [Methanobacterium sp.]|nr:hypothetical protein [Methanobacterium sp.]